MKAYKLNALNALLEVLQANYKVIDSENTGSPVPLTKSLLFPQQESVFVFDGEHFRSQAASPEANMQATAIMNIHACDLAAVAYMDTFFAEDPLYQNRRKNLLLVGLDCVSQCEHGFCHQVNTGPLVKTDIADIIVQPENNVSEKTSSEYLVIAISQKAVEATQGLQEFEINELPCLENTESLKQHRQQLEQTITKEFEYFPYIDDAFSRINKGDIKDEEWETYAQQCVTCSGCTQVCPTCTCYAVRDVTQDTQVEHQRFWDSCLYEGFQKEASGHNPSKKAGHRLERFWHHKISEDFVPQMGMQGCVGCGRCENACPSVIGVHAISKRIAENG